MAAKAARKAKKVDMETIAGVVYRVNALLHTMRAIERHEEQLCVIMTEIKTTGAMTASLDEELRDLLEQMPAHEYMDDIDAVRSALSPEILSADASQSNVSKRVSKAPKRAARAAKR